MGSIVGVGRGPGFRRGGVEASGAKHREENEIEFSRIAFSDGVFALASPDLAPHCWLALFVVPMAGRIARSVFRFR